jgi:hypothetical protein
MAPSLESTMRLKNTNPAANMLNFSKFTYNPEGELPPKNARKNTLKASLRKGDESFISNQLHESNDGLPKASTKQGGLIMESI